MSNSTPKAQSVGGLGENKVRFFRRVLDFLIQYNFIVIFLVLVIVASLLSSDFLTIQNVANLFQQATIVGVVAVGMTFVILTANIDLSVGSVVAFGGMVVAVLMKSGVPPFLAGCLTVIAGAVLGLGMGAITAYAKVPSFIITLAGLVSIRGVTYLISQGTPLGGFPQEFNALGSVRVGDFAAMSFVFFGITLVAFFILRFTVLGEYVYATGGNIQAARLSGVPARRIITLAFIISGALAGLAGVLLTSRLRIGQPTAAQGLELDAIAAVVLGGTSLFGGRGGVVGTFVAVMLLQVLRNLFNLLGLGSFYQMTVTGLIIVLAILLNKLIDSRSGGRAS
jgi:ribose transport system permease protein